ncbi:hypothetical protein CC78DRAFT_610888 [Lojkania enalia]|uniref:Uncharacterized protein n=1 Tax=Lojkania enalia TaxID=147567 RepID=A0A9P4TQT5_9PLEO|nr:hypothetical protein CC78DRAFT_610888 [Didymosphaeria enalia]
MRRMRWVGDSPPVYTRSWEHWSRLCKFYGIPEDFLCEEHVSLLRNELLRSENGPILRMSPFTCQSEAASWSQSAIDLPTRSRAVAAQDIEDEHPIVFHSTRAP